MRVSISISYSFPRAPALSPRSLDRPLERQAFDGAARARARSAGDAPAALIAAVRRAARPSLLIGYSTGAVAPPWRRPALQGVDCRGAFLVAPPDDDTLKTLDGGVWPQAPRARLPWPCVLVASRTDRGRRTGNRLRWRATGARISSMPAKPAGLTRIPAIALGPTACLGSAAFPEEAGLGVEPVRDLATLLAHAAPELQSRRVAVVRARRVSPPLPSGALIGSFREAEGLTLYVDLDAAEAAGLPIAFRAAWITMTVNSALDAVGFTAAFATALARAGISCNVIAGARHDHLFVPCEKAAAAMDALRRI